MNAHHKDILRQNTVMLTRDLTVDDEFLSYFVNNKVMTNPNIEEILVEKTTHKKNGAFLRAIQRRGPKAFPTIIEALVGTLQDPIAETLDHVAAQQFITKRDSGGATGGRVHLQETTPPISGRTPNFPQIPPAQQTVVEPKVNNAERSFMTVNIIPSNLMDERVQQILNDRENTYSILPRIRGRAVVINNEHFLKTKDGSVLSEREGTGFDLINLDTLLQGLHFQTTVHNNCTSKEMLKILEDESKNKAHEEADAFILCVLSHGANGYAFGVDGKKVSIEDEICAKFDGTHCRALHGKPKIFIIQACQGKESTVGVPVADDSGADEISQNLKSLKIGDQQDAAPQFLGLKRHEKADMLIAYSTVGGYKSWRRPDLGSWFIRAIVVVFAECAHEEHIEEMLTKVRRQVLDMQTSYQAGDIYVQVTKTESTLSRKFYFFPGFIASN